MELHHIKIGAIFFFFYFPVPDIPLFPRLTSLHHSCFKKQLVSAAATLSTGFANWASMNVLFTKEAFLPANQCGTERVAVVGGEPEENTVLSISVMYSGPGGCRYILISVRWVGKWFNCSCLLQVDPSDDKKEQRWLPLCRGNTLMSILWQLATLVSHFDQTLTLSYWCPLFY